MKILALNAEERMQTGFSNKISATIDDFKAVLAAPASDTTAVLPIFPGGTKTVPAGTLVRRCAMRLVTPFDASDASLNSALLEVGDGGDTDRFMPQTQLALDGTEILYFATPNATDSLPYAYLAADGIDAKLTTAGGGALVGSLTAGAVEIYLDMVDLNDFVRPA